MPNMPMNVDPQMVPQCWIVTMDDGEVTHPLALFYSYELSQLFVNWYQNQTSSKLTTLELSGEVS